MYTAFHNIDKEKQLHIINAAIDEFVQRGYEKASTNDIVKKARISKGSLFHYFHNKKQLYIYLIDYSMQFINQLVKNIDWNESDLFKRIEKIGLEKLYIQQKHPHVFHFLATTKLEEADDVKEIVQQKIDPYFDEVTKDLYKNIDTSKFRDGINIEKAIEIIHWTMNGFGEKGLSKMKTYEDIDSFVKKYMEEWREYAMILKESFYK